MRFKDKYPNQLFYLALITADEIIGKNGLKSVLKYAKLDKFIDNFPPDNIELEHSSTDFSRLLTGFIEVLGEKGARPLLFRGGMRAFEIMLEQFPSLMDINGIEPTERTPDRLFDEFKRIYGIIVDASNNLYGEIYKYYDCEEGVTLDISPCFWCSGLNTQSPICHAQKGFQLGVARWIIGQDVKIEETLCMAKGDDVCRFVIHRPDK